MKIKKHIILLLLISITLIYAKEPVEVCTDNSDWAPYTYYERNASGEKTDKFIGASIEALDMVSKKENIIFNIQGYPWKRCLKSVELFGNVKKFEAFMDGTSNKSREEKYLRTEPFYANISGVFYSKDRFPKGLTIKNAKDLDPYKICGVHGFNYTENVSWGMKNEIDTTAKSISSVLKKVSLGRCDVFVSSLEPILGKELLDNNTIPENVHYTSIKNNPKSYYYFWISKQSPRAEELRDKINKAMNTLKKDGTWETIYKRYIPIGSGLELKK